MRTLSLLLLAICLAAPRAGADSDDAQRAFLRQLALTRNFSLGRPTQATPTPDGKAVLFLRAQPRDPVNSLYEMDVASGQTKELLTPEALLKGAAEQLSPAERAQRERMRVSTRGFAHFQLSRDGKSILVMLAGKLYLVARADNRVTPLPTGALPALNPALSPDGKKVAYVHERDLYVLDVAQKREKRLTTSKDPAVSNGLAEFVAMEEMDRFRGFWWSPDSRALVYEEADARGVDLLHVADPARPQQAPEDTYYPRPGRPNVKTRLGVIAATGGATTWLSWDAAARPYLAEVSWRDDGPLTLFVMSRDQKAIDLLVADVKTGKSRLVYEETDPNWLELRGLPDHPWLPGAKQLLTRGIEDDTDVLQLRDADGKLVRNLSRAGDGYRYVIHVDKKRRVVWFSGGATSPEHQLYRVSLDGGAPVQLTRGNSEHHALFNDDCDDVFVDTAIDTSSMPAERVHALGAAGEDRIAGELPSVAEKPPFMSKSEFVQVGAQKWWVSITRPRDFDAHKKYPVIDDVYGGPTVTVVGYSPALMRQWMADHGYIVVAIDGRGTPHRTHAWRSFIVGDFSRTLDDQADALQALGAKYPELDLARVGITGWSFGGYLSALAVLKRPDVFKAATAGAPVVDWRDYDSTYTERYLGMPDANKAGYDKSSLLTYAPSLSRPLTIVHGVDDDNVYFLHTLKLVNALFRAGRPFRVIPVENLTHMVPDPVVRENLEVTLMNVFDDAFRPMAPRATAPASR
jgi:dipeptidyl-peptidase 4